MHTIHCFVRGIIVAEREESCHNRDMETSEKDVSAEFHARVQSTQWEPVLQSTVLAFARRWTIEYRVVFFRHVSPTRQTGEHVAFSSLAWCFDHS